ncbi:MAG TPA: PadR family transcriptional regulator [Longimicrobiales bacterium]|nr:PadR family transcriptional regulator [Longimicrobiales bacterium]
MRHGAQLLQGTLELLVLKTLSWEELNGFAIAQWIKERTAEDILIEEGALYPALHRLEQRGLIKGTWGVSENKRKARFYRLTAAGRRELQAQEGNWAKYVRAVDRVLQPA